MLIEESLWIGKKVKEILAENPFPVLNIGSSTKEYRSVRQPYIQQNIFNLFDEKNQVIHLDMKQADGVDIVGDLYDSNFVESLKKYRFKLIFCSNILMYIEEKQRKHLAKIIDEILEPGGYAIITNSHTFPPAPDPVEAYYRDSPEKIHQKLFPQFKIIEKAVVEGNYTFLKFLKQNPKLIPIKILSALMPFRKTREWTFMMKYYWTSLDKKYSASCLFLQK